MSTRIIQPGPVQLLNSREWSAVWPGDGIDVLCRVGSRRLCRVTWGPLGWPKKEMLALVPKRWMRTGKEQP